MSCLEERKTEIVQVKDNSVLMGKNNKFTKEHKRTFYSIKMAFIRYTNILFGYLRRRNIFDLWRNILKLLSVVTRIVSILWT